MQLKERTLVELKIYGQSTSLSHDRNIRKFQEQFTTPMELPLIFTAKTKSSRPRSYAAGSEQNLWSMLPASKHQRDQHWFE